MQNQDRVAMVRWYARCTSIVLLLGVCSSACFAQLARLLPAVTGTGGNFDSLGYAVAIDGDTAVAGAYGHAGPNATAGGEALVFVRVAGVWTLQATLRPNDVSMTGAAFGLAVAISGDTIVVSATGADAGAVRRAGAAYVFERSGSTWTQVAKLSPESPEFNGEFGHAVAIAGDVAVIGDPYASRGTVSRVGAVAIFVRSGTVWNPQTRLSLASTPQGDQFGRSVSLSGPRLLIGAGVTSEGVGSGGAAYVFLQSGNTWVQESKLVPSDPSAGMNFGAALALVGDRAWVGAPLRGGALGALYTFTRSGSTWTQSGVPTTPPAVPPMRLYGSWVAASVNSVAVGAREIGTEAQDTGVAYVYAHAAGVLTAQARLSPLTFAQGNTSAPSLALAGDTVLVGLPGALTSAGINAGVVGVYTRSGAIWNAQATLNAGDGASYNHFASALSASADWIVAGAPDNPVTSPQCPGSVSLFNRSGLAWNLAAELVPIAADNACAFGASVALDADTIAIGAPEARTGGQDRAGAVYLYVRNGLNFQLQAQLNAAANIQSNALFGTSLALRGDRLLIGSPGDNGRRGSVYSFVRSGSTWTRTARLQPSTLTTNSAFGTSVAIDASEIVSGASAETGNARGVVFRFSLAGTSLGQLRPADGLDGDDFGASLALANDTLVVGAPGRNNSGAVYFFLRNGSMWTNPQRFEQAQAYRRFGAAVAIDGNRALTGMPWFYTDINYSYDGLVFQFSRSSATAPWVAMPNLVANDSNRADRYGTAMAMGGGTLVVGAPYKEDARSYNFDVGVAYVFEQANSPGEFIFASGFE